MLTVSKALDQKYIGFLKTICMMETPTADKARIDKMVDFIEKFARDEGYAVERIPFEKAGDCLLVSLAGAPDKKPVLMMAHMDTVHPVGLFGEEILKMKDDVLYGPGTMDCKGGIAAAFYCLQLLKEEKNLRTVNLLLTADEEVSAALSGQKGIDLIKNVAKESYIALNMEAGGKHTVTVSRKGILKMQVDITGIAAHAGNAYFDGASAIKEAAHKILALEGLSEVGGVTYNCGVISGGTVVNTVPAECSFKVDIRFSTNDQMIAAEQNVYDLCEKCTVKGTVSTAKVLSRRPPMEKTEKNMQLLALWNEKARELGIAEYQGVVKGGGSDAAYSTILGVPTLCSCAIEGYDAHGITERVDLATLQDRVRIICEIIKSV